MATAVMLTNPLEQIQKSLSSSIHQWLTEKAHARGPTSFWILPTLTAWQDLEIMEEIILTRRHFTAKTTQQLEGFCIWKGIALRCSQVASQTVFQMCFSFQGLRRADYINRRLF